MKKMKKVWVLFAVFVLAFTMNVNVYAEDEPATVALVSPVNIKIVHTNDTHGRAYEGQDGASNIGAKATIAGFDKVKAVANSADPKYGGRRADFILDAGDLFHGLSFATIDQGDSIAQIIGAVGYDAISPGNHDWNYGQERLKELESKVQFRNPGFRMLAGNIEKNGLFFGDTQKIVKEIDGVKVGVFGVSDPRIKEDVAPYQVEGLTFQDEVTYANQMVAQLRTTDGCEVVIAVSHGLELEAFVAQTKGIDVLVGGHEHQVINKSISNADGKSVLVVEAGYYFNNIGVISLVYDQTQKVVTAATEIAVSASEAGTLSLDTEAQGVQDLMTQMKNDQAVVKNKGVGTSTTELSWGWPEVRISEQPIGRVITDSYLSVSGADIAFENAGGIRAGIPKGMITRGNVIDISPFGNYLETRTIKGSDIRGVLETSLEIGRQSKEAYDVDPGGNNYPKNSGSYLQCGGLHVTYDMAKAQGQRIQNMEVVKLDGTTTPFQEGAFYTVACSNYLATASEYPAFAASAKLAEYPTCEESIISYVGKGDATIQSSANRVRMDSIPTPLPKEMVTVQYTAEKGGTITGEQNQTIERGTDASVVKAVANSGYQFKAWSDGVKTAERTDKTVDKNISVIAAFTKTTAVADKKTPAKPAAKTADGTPIGSVLVMLAGAFLVTVYDYKKQSKKSSH
ncbi:MAG: 5'-nucleotidase C-terminal domain-containing protein [Lachnospiraceae bacterium]